MSNGGVYNDPGLRSPMSWTGVARTAGFTTGKPYRDVAINVASHNVADEAGDPSSLLEYYRALYTVRQRHPVLGTGTFRLQSKAGDPALVFSRQTGDDVAAVAVNVSDTDQMVSLWTGRGTFFNDLRVVGDTPSVPVTADGDGMVKVHLAPKSAVVMVRAGG